MAERSSYVFHSVNRSRLPGVVKFGPVNGGRTMSRENVGTLYSSVAIDQFFLSLDWGASLQKAIQWGYQFSIGIEDDPKRKLVSVYPLPNFTVSAPTTVVAYWAMVALEVQVRAMRDMLYYRGATKLTRSDNMYPTENNEALWRTSLTPVGDSPAFSYKMTLLCSHTDMLASIKPFLTKVAYQETGKVEPLHPQLDNPISYGAPSQLTWSGIAPAGNDAVFHHLSILPYNDDTLQYDCSASVNEPRALEVRANSIPIPEVNYVGTSATATNQGQSNSSDMESLSVLSYFFLSSTPKKVSGGGRNLYQPDTPGTHFSDYKDNYEWRHTPPLAVLYRDMQPIPFDFINLEPLSGINEPLEITFDAAVPKRKALFMNSDWNMDNVSFEVYLRTRFQDSLEAYQKPENSSQLGIKLYAQPLER